MLEHTRYHSLLRVSMIVAAVMLVYDSGILAPVTREHSTMTQQYLANAVGVSVGVPENELNAMTAEITERERELDEREAALNEREIAARDFGTQENSEESDVSTYILSAILFTLTVLIVLNYAMDYVRARRIRYAHPAS